MPFQTHMAAGIAIKVPMSAPAGAADSMQDAASVP